MKKKFKQVLCLFLSAAMVLTGNIVGAPALSMVEASAEEAPETVVYNLADLPVLMVNAVESVVSENTVSLSYGKAYSEILKSDMQFLSTLHTVLQKQQ